MTVAELPSKRTIEIGGRSFGPEATLIVAELSANHLHSFERALSLVDAAADAGADAIKLQTYTPDTITLKSEAEPFRLRSNTIWGGRTLHELYGEAYTPWEWHEPLFTRARERGLLAFSSPFDPTAVDFLLSLGVPAFKIASFELVDLGLIERVARTGKPLIMSTGMATLGEIEEAVAAARAAGARELALLKCTSAYPTPPSEMNLRTIPQLAATFDVPVGLSDHTLGIAAAVAAVALGAVIVEKHFTLSRADGGPDGLFSLEPHEFRQMVAAVREVEAALGTVSFAPTEHEKPMRAFRRSLFVVADMRAGDRFSEQNLRSIRPGDGLHTRHLREILGRRARRDIPAGTPMSWDLVD